jgi:hypothetical protein
MDKSSNITKSVKYKHKLEDFKVGMIVSFDHNGKKFNGVVDIIYEGEEKEKVGVKVSSKKTIKVPISRLVLCDISEIEKEIKYNNEKIKTLRKNRNECISEKAKYKNNMSLRELQELILKENKSNVREFLNLFLTTQDRSSGVKMTRNHVFEALWILSYLNRVDDLSDKRNRQFYKSLEKQETQTNEEVLNGNVNSSSGGGIADIYFEMDKGTSDKRHTNITTCNGNNVSIPHCENEPIEIYDRFLFSSKLYKKEKGAPKYDIQDIMVEASNKFGKTGYNIILLVNDKEILQKRMDRTDKIIGKSVHKILDMNDLDVFYKKLLYHLQGQSFFDIEKITNSLKPRIHQQYFIDYTKQCITKKDKKFVWGAVPRSGKSFMIGGLVSDVKPKFVFLILGAITETKDQFIKMFKDYETSFVEYSIHDLQNKETHNEGKSKHIFICSQEKIRMDNKKDNISDDILKILKEEKDKLIFFDEIHQGSGEQSMQGDMLQNLVFDNEYLAFIMVTATFAKPYLKYMNKGDEETKLLQWRYDDIQLMKDINKSVKDEETSQESNETYSEFLEKLKNEDDGDLKSHTFKQIIDDQLKQGKTLDNIASEYKIYPELVISTPIISDISEQYNGLIVDKDINIEGIFKPLMKKTISETNTCDKFIQYLFDEIYTKFLLRRLKYDVRNPHSEIWFLPTMLRDKDKVIDIEKANTDKKNKVSPFRNLTQNFVTRLMKNKFFKENYCFVILQSVGFDNTRIEFIGKGIGEGGQTITWSKADIESTAKEGCISTKCDKDIKNCVLEQEACAKAHGKSVIILTGKMLRLGVSLPCVDIALHMDPIKSVDTIYQSMFRVLTEREGKQKGIFIDLLTSRQISFMYDYTNYASNDKQQLGIEKKMKKLLENLVLFNFDGISNTQGSEYQQLYDKLMEQFSLNNPELFKINSQKIDLSKVSELLQDDRLSDLIIPFSELLNNLGINYSVVKGKKEKKTLVKRKGNEPKDEYEIEKLEKSELKKIPKELKEKYEEVSNFLNDCIMLFAIFKDNYNITFTRSNKKQSEDLKKEIIDFFSQDIEDIVKLCDNSDVDDDKIINCHLFNILKSNIDSKELTTKFNELKFELKKIFDIILEKDDFFNIYVNCIEEMGGIKNDAQQLKNKEPCAEDFIKDEKVLEIIRKRLSVREEEKNLYGEVFTPVELICEMFDHLPKDIWNNPNLKWLDPANGIGNFPVVAYYKLFDSLKSKIPDNSKRSKHIIENMLYMVELNPVNVRVCKKIFNMIDDKATPNIHTGSFIKGSRNEYNPKMKFDVIMGNPPYNAGGIKSKNTKKVVKNQKGFKTIWPIFVDKSINLLNDNKYLLFINPATWIGLKSTNSKMYMENQLLSLRFYNYGQALELFGSVSGKIPLTYYLLQKSKGGKNTEIYDNCLDKFIPFNIYKNQYIPIEAIKLQSKLKEISGKVGSLYEPVKKYDTCKNNTDTKNKLSSDYKYPLVNISMGNVIVSYSKINNNKKSEKKLVLPNDSMGYPLLDYEGNLYPSNAHDHVLYSNNNLKELKQLQDYFYTSLVFYMINITKLSQNFFEYKVFHVLPDITKMTKKEDINDADLIKLFKLDKEDIKCIEKYKENGEGRLSDSKIKEFKNWRLSDKSNKSKSKEPDISQPKPKTSPPVTPPNGPKLPPTNPVKTVKTVKKGPCSGKHLPEPCKEGFYPKPPKNCCYKKKTEKKGSKKNMKIDNYLYKMMKKKPVLTGSKKRTIKKKKKKYIYKK